METSAVLYNCFMTATPTTYLSPNNSLNEDNNVYGYIFTWRNMLFPMTLYIIVALR